MNFLDIQESAIADADVVILPIPYEGTVSYGHGTDKGPETIIATSAQVELYDIELGCHPFEKTRFHTCSAPDCSGEPEKVHTSITRHVSEAAALAKRASFFLGLGGEHSITLSILRGLLEADVLPGDTTVLQIDAHSDLRNEYQGSPLSHASVMRRIRDDLGLHTVHVGIRAMGDDEPEYVARNNVRMFPAPFSASSIPDILKALPENVFITFDVDGLDPSIMPSTGTPVPGGLLWQEALSLLRAVFETKNVHAMDIVELAPIDGFHAPDYLTAQLACKCIAYRMID